MKNAMHFVGFRDDQERFDRARRYFGQPDFVHWRWDCRAQAEIMEGDVAIFAEGTIADVPNENAYDDSAAQ